MGEFSRSDVGAAALVSHFAVPRDGPSHRARNDAPPHVNAAHVRIPDDMAGRPDASMNPAVNA